MRGSVRVQAERCKGCGVCIAFCPRKILAFDPDTTNAGGVHPARCVDEARCVACANCGLMCPDGAITVTAAS